MTDAHTGLEDRQFGFHSPATGPQNERGEPRLDLSPWPGLLPREHASPGESKALSAAAPSVPAPTQTLDWKDTNPKDGAATTRLDLSLFPTSAVAYGALAMTEGDLKYGGFNWRVSGVRSSVYVAALKRHVDKWYNGQDDDPKTLVPHLANGMACIGILIDAIEQGKLVDDRPPRQDVSLYDRFEKIVGHLQQIFPRRTTRLRQKQEGGS